MKLIDDYELTRQVERMKDVNRDDIIALIARQKPVDAVPVNWIEDYLEKIHEDLDYARQDNDEEAMKRIFWKYETIRWMVADWRHDEKTR